MDKPILKMDFSMSIIDLSMVIIDKSIVRNKAVATFVATCNRFVDFQIARVSGNGWGILSKNRY